MQYHRHFNLKHITADICSRAITQNGVKNCTCHCFRIFPYFYHMKDVQVNRKGEDDFMMQQRGFICVNYSWLMPATAG